MAPTTKTSNKDSGEVLTLSIFNSAMNKLDDKLENLVKSVDEKVTDLTKYIDNEVTLLTSRISKTEAHLHDLVSEGKHSNKSALDCIEQCIVISNLKAVHDEDQQSLRFKLANLFECMDCGDVAVVDCKRMGRAPCPLVKVALSSGDRAMVLKKKTILNRHSNEYSRVFIRPSKPLAERQMEQTVRALSRAFPQLNLMPRSGYPGVGNNFRYNQVHGQSGEQSQQQYSPPAAFPLPLVNNGYPYMQLPHLMQAQGNSIAQPQAQGNSIAQAQGNSIAQTSAVIHTPASSSAQK